MRPVKDWTSVLVPRSWAEIASAGDCFARIMFSDLAPVPFLGELREVVARGIGLAAGVFGLPTRAHERGLEGRRG